MKIIKNEKTGNLVKMEIESGAEEFNQAVEKTIDEAGQSMKLPGFRPGKAPKTMVVKNLDHEAIDNHAAQNLIGVLYPQILKEACLDPVDYPKINIENIKRGEPLIFTLEVEVYPEVKLGEYKRLSVEKKSCEVKEEEVIHVLGNLQDRLAKWKEVSVRPAQINDVIDLEIQAEAEGVEIKRWPRSLQYYPIGSNYICLEFDQALEGLEINQEKQFNVSFSSDYKVAEIAGKVVSFKIKILKISEKELIPIDDEFAKKLSKFGTLGEFKAEIQKNLEEEKKHDAEADIRNKLIEETSKNTVVDVPSALINIEIEMMMAELNDSLKHSNLTMENYLKSINKTEEEIKKDFIPASTARAKGKIILKAVANKENLAVTDADLDEEIKHMAYHEEREFEEYKQTLNKNTIEYVKDYLLRRKALDLIVKEADIK